ncbi:MAG: c-type cytochrome [Deltaproteobacteria bacterium]|nr:c-type cytochrome [Deltaproteobacteria bacterium]
MRRSLPFFPFFLAVSAGLAACDRAPSPDGLKEWTPADHDGEKKKGGAAQGPRSDAGDALAFVELTWRQQCASCHGVSGHADGPQAAMFKPPDLTNAELQSKLEDAQIAAAITNGKGRMPKFDLPEDVVRGLVQRVRSFRGK